MRVTLIATTATTLAEVQISVDGDQRPLRRLTKVAALKTASDRFATDEHPGAMNIEPEPPANGTTLPVVAVPMSQPTSWASMPSIVSLKAARTRRDQNNGIVSAKTIAAARRIIA